MSLPFQSRLFIGALTAFGFLGGRLAAQDPKALLTQRLTTIRESLAGNQDALRQYPWTETNVVSLKGEEKVRRQQAPEPGGRKRGLKAKIVDKKVGELKEYMDRAASLIRRYVPPEPAQTKSAFDAGKATLGRNAADSSVSMKPVAVSLNATFQPLADGTNYMSEPVLDAAAKQVQVRTTNFDHKKAAGQ